MSEAEILNYLMNAKSKAAFLEFIEMNITEDNITDNIIDLIMTREPKINRGSVLFNIPQFLLKYLENYDNFSSFYLNDPLNTDKEFILKMLDVRCMVGAFSHVLYSDPDITQKISSNYFTTNGRDIDKYISCSTVPNENNLMLEQNLVTQMLNDPNRHNGFLFVVLKRCLENDYGYTDLLISKLKEAGINQANWWDLKPTTNQMQLIDYFIEQGDLSVIDFCSAEAVEQVKDKVREKILAGEGNYHWSNSGVFGNDEEVRLVCFYAGSFDAYDAEELDEEKLQFVKKHVLTTGRYSASLPPQLRGDSEIRSLVKQQILEDGYSLIGFTPLDLEYDPEVISNQIEKGQLSFNQEEIDVILASPSLKQQLIPKLIEAEKFPRNNSSLYEDDQILQGVLAGGQVGIIPMLPFAKHHDLAQDSDLVRQSLEKGVFHLYHVANEDIREQFKTLFTNKVIEYNRIDLIKDNLSDEILEYALNIKNTRIIDFISEEQYIKYRTQILEVMEGSRFRIYRDSPDFLKNDIEFIKKNFVPPFFIEGFLSTINPNLVDEVIDFLINENPDIFLYVEQRTLELLFEKYSRFNEFLYIYLLKNPVYLKNKFITSSGEDIITDPKINTLLLRRGDYTLVTEETALQNRAVTEDQIRKGIIGLTFSHSHLFVEAFIEAGKLNIINSNQIQNKSAYIPQIIEALKKGASYTISTNTPQEILANNEFISFYLQHGNLDILNFINFEVSTELSSVIKKSLLGNPQFEFNTPNNRNIKALLENLKLDKEFLISWAEVGAVKIFDQGVLGINECKDNPEIIKQLIKAHKFSALNYASVELAPYADLLKTAFFEAYSDKNTPFNFYDINQNIIASLKDDLDFLKFVTSFSQNELLLVMNNATISDDNRRFLAFHAIETNNNVDFIVSLYNEVSNNTELMSLLGDDFLTSVKNAISLALDNNDLDSVRSVTGPLVLTYKPVIREKLEAGIGFRTPASRGEWSSAVRDDLDFAKLLIDNGEKEVIFSLKSETEETAELIRYAIERHNDLNYLSSIGTEFFADPASLSQPGYAEVLATINDLVAAHLREDLAKEDLSSFFSLSSVLQKYQLGLYKEMIQSEKAYERFTDASSINPFGMDADFIRTLIDNGNYEIIFQVNHQDIFQAVVNDALRKNPDKDYYRRIIDKIIHDERLTSCLNTEFYQVIRAYLQEEYQVDIQNLDYIVTNYGAQIIPAIVSGSLREFVNQDSDLIVKTLALFPKEMDIGSIDAIYESLLSERYRLNNPSDFEFFNRVCSVVNGELAPSSVQNDLYSVATYTDFTNLLEKEENGRYWVKELLFRRYVGTQLSELQIAGTEEKKAALRTFRAFGNQGLYEQFRAVIGYQSPIDKLLRRKNTYSNSIDDGLGFRNLRNSLIESLDANQISLLFGTDFDAYMQTERSNSTPSSLMNSFLETASRNEDQSVKQEIINAFHIISDEFLKRKKNATIARQKAEKPLSSKVSFETDETKKRKFVIDAFIADSPEQLKRILSSPSILAHFKNQGKELNLPLINMCIDYLSAENKQDFDFTLNGINYEKDVKKYIGKLRELVLEIYDFGEFRAYLNFKSLPMEEITEKAQSKNMSAMMLGANIFSVLENIRLAEINENILNNPELYEKLKVLLSKYKLNSIGNIFSEFSDNLECNSVTISSLIQRFGTIISRIEESGQDTLKLIDLIKFAAVYASASDAMVCMFGDEDLSLLRTNPGPNQASMAVRDRLSKATEYMRIIYERNEVNVPPFEGIIQTEEGKALRVTMGEFKSPMNLTLGERTGACMRIGGVGRTLFDYTLREGFHIIFTNPETGKLISRVTGFRNGNTVFLNQLRESLDKAQYSNQDIITICQQLCEALVEKTAEAEVPIENVYIHHSYAMHDSNMKSQPFGPVNIKDGLGEFYADIGGSGILMASKEPEGVPIVTGNENVEKYPVLRTAPISTNNMETIIEYVNRVNVMAEFIEHNTYLNYLRQTLDEHHILHSWLQNDWYIFLDENGDIHKKIITLDPRAQEEFDKAHAEALNIAKQLNITAQMEMEEVDERKHI